MEDEILIIAITPPDPVPGLASRIERMLVSGAVDRVHVRFPGKDIKEFVHTLPDYLKHRISVHSSLETADSLGVNAHCLQAGALSCSCHSVEETTGCGTREYVFLSPVFDSISKPGYVSEIQLYSPDLRATLRKKRVVALGGVCGDNLPVLIRAGFAGAALLGWLDVEGAELDRRLETIRKVRDRRRRLLSNIRLQFITDSPTVNGTVTQAMKALEGGCRWIQVRMKNATVSEVRNVLKQLAPVCKDADATLLVDDYVSLADLCDGVHLGRNDVSPVKARQMLGSGVIIGYTVNNPADARRAATYDIDYVGMGPWRHTYTKKKLSAVLGKQGFASLVSTLRHYGGNAPVVAVGGLNTSDISDVVAYGASGVAVSGAIGRADDPVGATKAFINSINICKTKKTF